MTDEIIYSTHFALPKYWYALYTMPRAEKKVEERLIKHGTEVYLPLVESVRIWSDRKKKIKVPLIPGYVFLHCMESEISQALETKGALGVIRYLGKPARMRDSEIATMRILQNESTDSQLIEKLNVQEGEWIQVVHGPFMGLIGRYVRFQGRYRVVIEIETLGSMFEVNVPMAYLQKIQHKVA